MMELVGTTGADLEMILVQKFILVSVSYVTIARIRTINRWALLLRVVWTESDLDFNF